MTNGQLLLTHCGLLSKHSRFRTVLDRCGMQSYSYLDDIYVASFLFPISISTFKTSLTEARTRKRKWIILIVNRTIKTDQSLIHYKRLAHPEVHHRNEWERKSCLRDRKYESDNWRPMSAPGNANAIWRTFSMALKNRETWCRWWCVHALWHVAAPSSRYRWGEWLQTASSRQYGLVITVHPVSSSGVRCH